MTPTLLPIEIAVRVHERESVLRLSSEYLFCASVERYARELASEAGLSLTPQVTLIDAADEAELLPGERFRLRIGTTLARTPLLADHRASGTHAGDDVALALYTNRLTFLQHADATATPTRAGEADSETGNGAWHARRHLLALGVSTARLTDGATNTTLDVLDRLHDEALRWEVECHAKHVDALTGATAELRESLGVPLPPPVIRAGEVATHEYRLRVNDVALPVRIAPHDIRNMLGQGGEYDEVESFKLSLARDLMRYTPLLVSGAVVDFLLAAMRSSAQALVDGVHQRFTSPTVAQVFRGLLEESFPIRDLRGVLEAMLTAAGRSCISDRRLIVIPPHTGGMLLTDDPLSDQPLNAAELVEIVRAQHARAIRMQVAPQRGAIPIFVADPAFEEALSTRGYDRALVQAVADAVGAGRGEETTRRIIAIASPSRRPLRDLVHVELPHVFAVDWLEIYAEAELNVSGLIELPGGLWPPGSRAEGRAAPPPGSRAEGRGPRENESQSD